MATIEREIEIDQRFTGYIEGVLSGEIVTGRLVRLAVERHERDLKDGPSRGLRFDAQTANDYIGFIECMQHVKGDFANTPFIMEPWEVFIAGSLFGWKLSDGLRRFRTAYIEVGRKNGKSFLAAAIGHCCFILDGEEGAEVYTSATKFAQAKIVHDTAKQMVQKSKSLNGLITILRDTLIMESTCSKYAPLGADKGTDDGLNVHCAIVDEVHAHKTRDAWDVLETATGARSQPLMLAITTAGDGGDTESICRELRDDYTVKILNRSINEDSWFGYIACLDEGDSWWDEKNWIKANPNLGVSVSVENLRILCDKAVAIPSAQNNFRRKHCNEWVGSDDAWLNTTQWEENRGGIWYDKDGLLPEVRERYRGKQCWVGGDLSSVQDLTALVFAFHNDLGGVDVLPFCWCPRDNAIGRQKDRKIPYMTWSERGQMFLTSGNSVDYSEIRALLRKARDEWGFDIAEVIFDPHNARYPATMIEQEDEFVVVEHRQGFISMNEPCKTAERLVLDKKIRHGGHEPLAWCMGNAVRSEDSAGNIKLDKKKSREKIDLAVAFVMAVGRACANDTPSTESYYDDPDNEMNF